MGEGSPTDGNGEEANPDDDAEAWARHQALILKVKENVLIWERHMKEGID